MHAIIFLSKAVVTHCFPHFSNLFQFWLSLCSSKLHLRTRVRTLPSHFKSFPKMDGLAGSSSFSSQSCKFLPFWWDSFLNFSHTLYLFDGASANYLNFLLMALEKRRRAWSSHSYARLFSCLQGCARHTYMLVRVCDTHSHIQAARMSCAPHAARWILSKISILRFTICIWMNDAENRIIIFIDEEVQNVN